MVNITYDTHSESIQRDLFNSTMGRIYSAGVIAWIFTSTALVWLTVLDIGPSLPLFPPNPLSPDPSIGFFYSGIPS
ncbi:hypothetical protein JB92DRAFT_3118587 [Gautieria morchelliformis]|nr:hypothetical protein JB92DRAFT_3118587 [Gautieria morchelliformis]